MSARCVCKLLQYIHPIVVIDIQMKFEKQVQSFSKSRSIYSFCCDTKTFVRKGTVLATYFSGISLFGSPACCRRRFSCICEVDETIEM